MCLINRMSSVSRGYAARVTKRFTAVGNLSNDASYTGGAWLVNFATMYPTLAFYNPTYDQPFLTLKCKFVTFGSSSDLIGALNAVWNNVELFANANETLIDMGREIKFGVAGGESDLVTFRVVQRTSGFSNNNGVDGAPSYGVGNDTGFNTYLVPVENRLSGGSLLGVFPVQVARM